MRFALVACRATSTNEALAAARDGDSAWELMSPERALEVLQPGDAALGRLDVLPTLDGVDDGLWALGALAARGVAVLNEASSLLATHDKLLTARLLHRVGVVHPLTRHVRANRPLPALRPPVVVKPRFGSWGQDVYRCEDARSLHATLARLAETPWYPSQGALVQELVPPRGYDLRILVAEARIVGAVYRVATAGEWRTNVALGGVRQAVPDLPSEACMLALAAARASGASLVGVDLLPRPGGGWIVLELNGAVEFTDEYALSGDVFAEVTRELEGAAVAALAEGTLALTAQQRTFRGRRVATRTGFSGQRGVGGRVTTDLE